MTAVTPHPRIKVVDEIEAAYTTDNSLSDPRDSSRQIWKDFLLYG